MMQGAEAWGEGDGTAGGLVVGRVGRPKSYHVAEGRTASTHEFTKGGNPKITWRHAFSNTSQRYHSIQRTLRRILQV